MITLSNLSTLYMQMRRFGEGRIYSDRAVALLRTITDPPPSIVFKTMANAAAVSAQTGKPEETDLLFQSAMAFCERTFAPNHHLLGSLMMNYAEFLRRAGRRVDAKAAQKRATKILAHFDQQNLVGLTVDAWALR